MATEQSDIRGLAIARGSAAESGRGKARDRSGGARRRGPAAAPPAAGARRGAQPASAPEPAVGSAIERALAGGILAIETSQERGSVAWSAGPGSAPTEELFSVGLVHGREILPRIESLRERSGFERDEIALVAVSAGPGSFTGLRIGVSAAKALAFALRRPALALSSLEVIARNVREDGEIAVLLDARRGRAYGARFLREKGALRRLSEDRSLPPEQFFAELPPTARLLGAGARTFPGAEAFLRFPAELDLPRAAEVAALARERLAELARGGELPAEFEDPHQLVPVYLLRPGPEEAREGGP